MKYGRLTVKETISAPRGARALCVCECGNEKTVLVHNLKSGRTQSCGCLRAERIRSAGTKHGLTSGRKKPPGYSTWLNMQQRCSNPNSEFYHLYGGRGIRVCERWTDSRSGFENFILDMGQKPGPAYSINRIENDGDYEPSNCEWATAAEQNRNKRSNVLVVIGGQTMVFADALKSVGRVSARTARKRLRAGWRDEDAFTTPRNRAPENF